jgi:PhnB protein
MACPRPHTDMNLVPYLNFPGQCREAMEHYAELLGANVVAMLTHGESPMAEHLPLEQHGTILHARIERDGFTLMASDAPPDRYLQPQGLWVSIQVDAADEADRIFSALSDGGKVAMPIDETFWATRFGMVVDRFGTPWMVNCEH